MPISALVHRALRRVHERLTLFGGWTWIAAGSLVGFEMLDLVFGTFVLAPELIPLVILCLALAWYFRRRLRWAWNRTRAAARLLRLRRRGSR
ncbi:hypothetical protein [Gryllotalpicola protaetiae]|uniref:Uncharacterized protein n=1 Tax=Gryllotalpicola protaetiae TaxID=2419771 RepID=A0A387BLR9_9MICO|nr:hypothetical protein [Gryllotalpicola protaetiae]AYG02149.1 hypothetical protein D7I44_00460 [Gryllotalpicola protaetiae]